MRTPRRLQRSARMPDGISRKGTTTAYVAARRPMVAAVNPILAQEELLDWCPEADAEKKARHKEWSEALSNSCRGIRSGWAERVTGGSGVVDENRHAY